MDSDAADFALPILVWREVKRLLRYERDRAPDALQALNAWRRDLRGVWVKAQRLGPHTARRLMNVENLCAAEGLCLAADGSDRIAPWHLPERLLVDDPASIPAHPLIDLSWWMSQLPAARRPKTGIEAIAQLFSDAPRRWSELPVLTTPATLPEAPIAVCLHLYYPDLWPEISEALQALPYPWDLFITIPRFAATPLLKRIVAEVPRVRFVPVPNRGRDVLPWLYLLRHGALDHYRWVCKLHTKKSPHMTEGKEWRLALLRGLLSSSGGVASRLEQLDAMPNAGIAGPASALVIPRDRRFVGGSAKALQRTRINLGWGEGNGTTSYFAGTMFWFRPSAMAGLEVLADAPQSFAIEAAQTDGTTAHAVERLAGECAARNGFQIEVLR